MQEPILQDFKKTEPVISYAGFFTGNGVSRKGLQKWVKEVHLKSYHLATSTLVCSFTFTSLR